MSIGPRTARAFIDLGNDPANEQKDAPVISLGAGLEMYARAKLDHQRTGHTTERDLRRDYGPLLDLPAMKVTTQMVASIIDIKAQSAPIMANRLLGYSAPWFRWLMIRGLITLNPVTGIEKPTKETARERSQSPDEIAAIWYATRDLGYPFGPFIRLLLLTGIRRDELAGMRHDEIELDKKLWNVPASRSKTGAAIRIPLSELAINVLSDVNNVGGTFVFTTTGKSPVSGFSKMKLKLDRLSGVSNWRLHDFRRTMVSAMVDFGIDATTADRCLNHTGAATMSTVQRVYQRSDLLDQRRHALRLWAKFIRNICEEYGDED